MAVAVVAGRRRSSSRCSKRGSRRGAWLHARVAKEGRRRQGRSRGAGVPGAGGAAVGAGRQGGRPKYGNVVVTRPGVRCGRAFQGARGGVQGVAECAWLRGCGEGGRLFTGSPHTGACFASGWLEGATPPDLLLGDCDPSGRRTLTCRLIVWLVQPPLPQDLDRDPDLLGGPEVARTPARFGACNVCVAPCTVYRLPRVWPRRIPSPVARSGQVLSPVTQGRDSLCCSAYFVGRGCPPPHPARHSHMACRRRGLDLEGHHRPPQHGCTRHASCQCAACALPCALQVCSQVEGRWGGWVARHAGLAAVFGGSEVKGAPGGFITYLFLMRTGPSPTLHLALRPARRFIATSPAHPSFHPCSGLPAPPVTPLLVLRWLSAGAG